MIAEFSHVALVFFGTGDSAEMAQPTSSIGVSILNVEFWMRDNSAARLAFAPYLWRSCRTW